MKNQLYIFFQIFEEKLESTGKQLRDAEERSSALQLTVDKLAMSLAKSEESENQLKNKVKIRHACRTFDQLTIIDDLSRWKAQLKPSEMLPHPVRFLKKRLDHSSNNYVILNTIDRC